MKFSSVATGFLLLATAIALSGCTSSKPTTVDPEPTGPTVGADSGAIQGVVTNAELEPIKNAQVALQSSASDPVLSGADGMFHFSEVPPGRHVMYVTALGYSSIARNVDVVVGEIVEANVQLEMISTDAAFSTNDIKQGYIACGTGAGTDGAGASSVQCGSADANQKFLFNYTFAKGLKGVLFEMTWKPTQALSRDLALIVEKDGCGVTCEEADTFAEVQGCCYLRVPLTIEDLTKPAGDEAATDFTERAGTIQTRTFPAFAEQGRPATVFTAQEFEIHVEFFYHELPADWETRSNIAQ